VRNPASEAPLVHHVPANLLWHLKKDLNELSLDHLAKARYAVGLELHLAVGTWVDVSQPPRAGV